MSHCIAIPTLLQIYFISLFRPSLFAPSPAFLRHHAQPLRFCCNFFIFFAYFMVMSLTNLAVSVAQAFTHLAIGMQFSFQALILLYEFMELMRFYPPAPHTHTHNLSIPPRFPHQPPHHLQLQICPYSALLPSPCTPMGTFLKIKSISGHKHASTQVRAFLSLTL